MSTWTPEREEFIRDLVAIADDGVGIRAEILAALDDERARRVTAEAAQAAVNEAASRRIARAAAERDAWRATAEQESRNRDYYRGLLDLIGIAIGESAFIADDGTRSESPLRAKLPDLVARLHDAATDAAAADDERARREAAEMRAEAAQAHVEALARPCDCCRENIDVATEAVARAVRAEAERDEAQRELGYLRTMYECAACSHNRTRAEQVEAERDEARAALAVLREAWREADALLPWDSRQARDRMGRALSAAAPIAGRYRASVLREAKRICDDRGATAQDAGDLVGWQACTGCGHAIDSLADAAEKGEGHE